MDTQAARNDDRLAEESKYGCVGNGGAIREVLLKLLGCGAGAIDSRTIETMAILSNAEYASESEYRWSARV